MKTVISAPVKRRRVIIYRLGSLGDTLVALPAFHLVRQVFPDAHITLLTNVPLTATAPPMEEILRNTNLYDDSLSYPTSLRDVARLRELRTVLKAGEYDCLIYLTEPKGGILRSIRDYLFFRWCGIRQVIGVPFASRTLRPVTLPDSELFLAESARVLECIRELGTPDVRDPKWWDLQLTPAEIAEADTVLRAQGISGRFLAASVGTKIQPNDWEDPNWTKLLERVAADFHDLPLVFFGAEEERERCARLAAVWRGPKANLCGAASPRVGAAMLRRAALMLCHDSGPMHLAATVGVPCVAIFSARNPPGVWFPRGENHTVLYHRTPCWGCKLTLCVENKKACILSITVEEVHDAVRRQLARGGFPAGAKCS